MKFVKLATLSMLVAILAPLSASAQDDDKPFAEAHIVLQLADGDAASQERVLSVANNLIKHYGGPDFVDIEIVAYGPGLALLFTGNENEQRISSLLANDVRFVGCLNTVESIERKTGTRPELIAETIFVQTGVAQLVERAQQGFVVIRP
jgi:intracellular sulfur oxidation DsrE/DsrF family protein